MKKKPLRDQGLSKRRALLEACASHKQRHRGSQRASLPLNSALKITRGVMLFLMTLLALTPSQSARARVSVGVQLLSPTGLSAQVELTRAQALNATLAYDLDREWFIVGVDYRVIALPLSRGAGGLYWGVGGALSSWGEGDAWARAPFGLELNLRSLPLQGFVELTPTLGLIPRVSLGLGAGLGVRWRF